jgi:hypothetical protein
MTASGKREFGELQPIFRRTAPGEQRDRQTGRRRNCEFDKRVLYINTMWPGFSLATV